MHDLNFLVGMIRSCNLNNNLTDAKELVRICANNTNDIELLDRLAYFQSELKDYTECIKTLEKCLLLCQVQQQIYSVRANMAKIYNHLNEPRLSIAQSKANLIIDPNNYDTQLELAFSHYLAGDYATSEKMMREIASRPNLSDSVRGRVDYNIGSYDMEIGLFKKGLRGFIDVGHKIGIWKTEGLKNVPTWKGEHIEGKTLYVHGEGGIGDELIAFRFTENIKNLGGKIVWITHHSGLNEVFNRHGIECVQNIDKPVDNSVQCMAMYLPLILDLDKHDVWNGPYLTASQKYIDKWSRLLPQGNKLVVKWAGNPAYDQDLHRSLPEWFIEDLEFEGTKVSVALEPDNRKEQFFNAQDHIKSIEDTLAIIHICDGVVTSCTSVAHMAGALGKRTIVCPPIAYYYTWSDLKPDSTSHWYGSNMKVFRQQSHKYWGDVFDNVQNEVKGWYENSGIHDLQEREAVC